MNVTLRTPSSCFSVQPKQGVFAVKMCIADKGVGWNHDRPSQQMLSWKHRYVLEVRVLDAEDWPPIWTNAISQLPVGSQVPI